MKTIKRIALFGLIMFGLSQSAYANPSVEQISPADAYTMLQQNKDAILIDVRNGFEYDQESIPFAIMINKEKLVKNFDLYKNILTNKTIILHCRSGVRGSSAAQSLSSLTQNKVYNLQGGIMEWKKQNLPIIQSTKIGLPIMRQVQMIAGSLIVAFGLLSLFANKKFVFGCIFVGSGLFFAGATGSCTMARILQVMPWN